MNHVPSLLWSDGSTITKKEAIEECSFVVKMLYESLFYLNANKVEAGLQRHYKEGCGYELGHRLWRVSGVGDDLIKMDANAGSEKVVVTYSLMLQQMIDREDGEVLVNP